MHVRILSIARSLGSGSGVYLILGIIEVTHVRYNGISTTSELDWQDLAKMATWSGTAFVERLKTYVSRKKKPASNNGRRLTMKTEALSIAPEHCATTCSISGNRSS